MSSLEMQDVFAQIDRDFEAHLDNARSWIRQPSISSTGEGIAETVAKLATELQACGAAPEVIRTPGHPVVLANIDVGAPVTVLIYGMYDVQPVDGESWTSPPFSAEIREYEGLGPCLVGRGARNQKGPLAASLNVIQAFKAAGKNLPVNIKLVIEGEEELGSRNLPGVLEKYRDRLKADVAFFPVFSQTASGRALLHLGVKGLIYLALVARGGPKGGPRSHMIHSRNAVWIDNPAWRLIHALSQLVSLDGHVRIPGFYDSVRSPDDEDLILLNKLAAEFQRDEILSELDSERFMFDETAAELIQRYCFSPTVNIDGIIGGYTDDGTKTVIPNTLQAKLDIRLVKDMAPDTTIGLLRTHLDEIGFDDIEIVVQSSYPAARSSMQSIGARALFSACTLDGHEPEVWPTLAGSAPFYLFEELLGIPFVMGGLGHAARSHSPDEFCTVEGLKNLEKSIAHFFFAFRREMDIK